AARAAAREQRRGGFGPFGRQAPTPKPETQTTAEKLTPPTTGVIPPNTDLYDETTLRTLYLQFEDTDWYEELGDFYRTDVEVPADLIVDGMTYPGVGVRFRGNSSYFGTGQSRKKPFNISVDFTDEDQRLYGYRTLNLHNCHEDPSLLREVLYSQICREYTPALKANFVKLAINGENWGVYANVQQFNRDFLRDWFRTGRGFRWKVGMGRGGSLTWLGPDPSAYKRAYEIKSGDEPDAWVALIRLCESLNSTPDDQVETSLNAILNVDQALWLIALENIFIDEGYVTRGADYALYTDGRYGRFHLLSIDNNETLTYGGGPFFKLRISGAELDPLALADDESRPVIHRLLSIPHLRARYLAHVRTIVNESLDWNVLAPIVESYQKLIAEEVKADTKKLYSYEGFIRGHVEDYTREGPPGGGPFGGGPPGGGPFGGGQPGGPQTSRGLPGQAARDPDQPLGGEWMLRRFDANGDGMISKDEVPEQAQRFIQDFDRNGDGAVTTDELPQGDPGVLGGRRRGGRRPGRGPGGGGGPGRGVTPSLKRFVEERREFILSRPEINKPYPVIQEVTLRVKDSPSADSTHPLPTEHVHVQAKVSGEVPGRAGKADSVILYYAEARWAPFDQAPMFDDGAHEDGDAGDGLYGGDIPPFPAGTQVHYYVEARAPASVGTTTFSPSKAEFGSLTYRVATPIASATPVVINELMAENETTIRDPQGDYDDWIELLNVSGHEVDLSGMYLSDRRDNPRKWAFPSGTILAPGDYLVVWADEDGEAKPGLHANFKLSSDGEVIMLIDSDERGNALLDSVTFGKQEPDAALGRLPDGKGAFRALQATPGGTNEDR
ncbi:CotH kinase family protein, partial [bacterium]|nr:CotH kinase family protein [bacterium]